MASIRLMNINQKGFTLVELLVVISVISVLSGVVISVIDVNRQRNVANDAVAISNMTKLTEGLESFYASNGRPPGDSDTDRNPLTGTHADQPEIARFISTWPTGFTYYTSGANYCVSIPMPSNTTTVRYFKFSNPDNVSSATCKGKVMKNCTNACSTDYGTSGCSNLTDVAC